ncbi:hypothetical protein L2E82_31346 [Cichorium intybus]|uniref:Uncharacterized protein n=1 Tax=Cichorium intybus TaxID=13427 RepID=A0ACB9D322_CICIN|nr:hypothetical protein L2E82_31346 [Cichorium intybus]
MNTQGGGVNQDSCGVTQHSISVNEGVSGIGHKDNKVVTDEMNIHISEGVSGIGLKETVDEVENTMDEILQGGYVEGNAEVNQVGSNKDEGNVEVSRVGANEDEGNVEISQHIKTKRKENDTIYVFNDIQSLVYT